MVLQASDTAALSNLAPVAKSLLERIGFKVDLQPMDWQSLVNRLLTKKGPPSEGGWNVFLTYWSMADLFDPLMTPFLQSNCEKSRAGWPCDAEMETLRERFALAGDAAERKAIALEVQKHQARIVTHVHLGEGFSVAGMRKNVTGWIDSPVVVFWGIDKQ